MINLGKNLFERIKNHYRGLTTDCIILEEWTTEYNRKEENLYIAEVLGRLKLAYPQMQLLSFKRADSIELRNTGYYLFDGYEIKLVPNLPLVDLKKKCIEFETNEKGVRISDIDIYYKEKKISRKNGFRI